MEERKVPLRSLSKPTDVSLAQAHEVSSVLYNLIKDGVLRTNLPKLSFNRKVAKGEVSFEQ